MMLPTIPMIIVLASSPTGATLLRNTAANAATAAKAAGHHYNRRYAAGLPGGRSLPRRLVSQLGENWNEHFAEVARQHLHRLYRQAECEKVSPDDRFRRQKPKYKIIALPHCRGQNFCAEHRRAIRSHHPELLQAYASKPRLCHHPEGNCP